MATRDEKVAALTKQLMQGGWSSVYSFVDSHVEDWELDDEDEDDDDFDDDDDDFDDDDDDFDDDDY